MIFDCIIMNPPYGSNKTKTVCDLHLQITKEAIELCDGIVSCLMPIALLTASKKMSTNNKSQRYKDYFDKYLISVDEVDSSVFNDTNMANIAIWTFDKNKKPTDKINIAMLNKNVVTVASMSDYDNHISAIDKHILDKITKYPSIVHSRLALFVISNKKIKNDPVQSAAVIKKFLIKPAIANHNYFICLNYANSRCNAQWQTTKLKDYKIINGVKQLEKLLNSDNKCKSILGFDTQKEAENVLKLLDHNCLRFGLAKMQDDQNMQKKVYTYFPDIAYNNINSEQKFYDFFNITPAEQKIIEEKMEKYK